MCCWGIRYGSLHVMEKLYSRCNGYCKEQCVDNFHLTISYLAVYCKGE